MGLGCDAAPAPRSEWTCSSERTGAVDQGYGRLQTLLRQLRVGLPVRETQLFSSVQQEARGRHALRRPRRAADHVKEQMKRWATAERLIQLYRAGRRDA